MGDRVSSIVGILKGGHTFSRRKRLVAAIRERFGVSRLSGDQARVLEQLRSDARGAAQQYRPPASKGWADLVSEFDALFNTDGIGDVEIQPYNGRFSAFPPGDRAYYTYACFQLLQTLRERDKWGVLDLIRQGEADFAPSRHRIVLDGMMVTWDLLNSIENIMTAMEADASILTRPVVVLDLGAGWGRIGHALLRLNPNATYISADLPETLLISQTYLPTTLPGVAAYGHEHHRGQSVITRDRLLSEPGVHFMGAGLISKIEGGAIDLFVNVASFQEMPNSQVEAYFDDIDRVTRGHLFIQQSKLASTKGGFQVAGTGLYPFRPSWEQKVFRDCPHFPDYFEAVYKIG